MVFFGLGFETTTPSTALTIQQAAREGLANFSVFCNHITVPPPIRALLDDPDMLLDGFVGPGHVRMVIGTQPYDFIARDYGKPIVVAGFEPLDLLQSVLMVLRADPRRAGRGREPVFPRRARSTATRSASPPRRGLRAAGPPSSGAGWARSTPRACGSATRYAAFDAEEKFGIGYGAGPPQRAGARGLRLRRR